mmetsp:Transcript_28651/g.49677  ORF Transcript_28651/g.49677 Transcript_28651/m.49677 type:complete len:224 (+) Transcript_28651:81-752(+)
MSRILEKLGLKEKPDPIEQAKEWKKNLRREERGLEREIRKMDRDEKKVEAEIKKLAKQNQIPAVKVMAKNLVQMRNAKTRLYSGRAQIGALQNQIQHTIATMKVAGAMQASTEVLSSLNNLIKLPEINATMLEMAREMEKAGLISEMVDDTFEIIDGEEIDELADEELERVIAEVTEGRLAGAELAPTHVPAGAQQQADEEKLEEKTPVDEEQERLRARLDAL